MAKLKIIFIITCFFNCSATLDGRFGNIMYIANILYSIPSSLYSFRRSSRHWRNIQYLKCNAILHRGACASNHAFSIFDPMNECATDIIINQNPCCLESCSMSRYNVRNMRCVEISHYRMQFWFIAFIGISIFNICTRACACVVNCDAFASKFVWIQLLIVTRKLFVFHLTNCAVV